MTANIFVVGLDPFNYRKLETIAKTKSYNIQPLLDVQDVKKPGPLSIEDLLTKAENNLASFSGNIDAIIGYWDFPVTCLVPFLNQRLGLPSPSFESVLKCEHKFWCRLEQSKVIKNLPKFCGFNPFDDQALSTIQLDYPFWIKPVKAFASQLGFRIHNAKEFHESLNIIRQGITQFSDPFNFFLKQIPLPPEVATIGGDCCLAEEIISGRQCTLEGFAFNNHVEVYGVVDSIREPNRSTFSRYEYPSKLPKRIQERMIETAKTFISYIGYDNAPFNIEFFYDEHHDRISVLEINPRISQSHCDLFEKVDGASHHEVMIDLALGKKPDFPKRQGPFKCAAKFFIRHHGDAFVKGGPSLENFRNVQEMFPDTLMNIHVKPGMRLSDLLNQESYSYELGYLCMGAANEHELLENHRRAQEHLPFELVP